MEKFLIPSNAHNNKDLKRGESISSDDEKAVVKPKILVYDESGCNGVGDTPIRTTIL